MLCSWPQAAVASVTSLLSVAATPLTPVQSRLIALVTYIQVARDHCRYGIDVDLLRKAAADIGVTFQTPEQAKALVDVLSRGQAGTVALTRRIGRIGGTAQRSGRGAPCEEVQKTVLSFEGLYREWGLLR